MILLYFTLVRSKLDHVIVVWNSVTTSDASKLEQRNYDSILDCLKCRMFYARKRHQGLFFLADTA